MRLLLIATALVALLQAPASTAADAPNLHVAVSNVESDAGKLVIVVWDNEDDWLSDRFRTVKALPVKGNRTGDKMSIDVQLPPGDYAYSVFQDIDDDGKLKRNFIGIPKEPTGLSNNVRPRFGPPKFADARFTLGADPVEHAIRLQ